MPKVKENKTKEVGIIPAFTPPPLDTLGQLPTKPAETLKKRARSKWWTRAVVGRLLYLNSPLHKTYQRAFYCSNVLLQEKSKVTTTYCDSRVCHICNRIRTAKMINGYVSQFENLGSLEFTTLTVPNVKAHELKDSVDILIKSASNITRVLRERKNLSVSGIRKIEVTYNSIKDDYHPHLHILNDSNVGDIIIDEWLKRHPNANRIAQLSKPADKSSLNEIFKYTTKIVSRKKGSTLIYIPALDVIMQSLAGRRTFQPFGKIRRVEEDIEELQSEEYKNLPDYDLIEWVWSDNDWINNYGENLTGYKPPTGDIDFIE